MLWPHCALQGETRRHGKCLAARRSEERATGRQMSKFGNGQANAMGCPGDDGDGGLLCRWSVVHGLPLDS